MNARLLHLIGFALALGTASGQAPPWTWATSAGGDNVDRPTDMAVDGDQAKYIAGFSWSDTLHFGNLSLGFADNAGNKLLLCKYGADDIPVWVVGATGIADYGGPDVDLEDDLVVVTGYYSADTMKFDNGIMVVNPEPFTTRQFRAHYTTEGTLIEAVDLTELLDPDFQENKRVTDTNGNAYAIGSFSSPTVTFGPNTYNHLGSSDGYVVKYNQGGTAEWSFHVGTSGLDYMTDIELDEASGHIVVAGGFTGPSVQLGSESLVNPGTAADGFIARINLNGTVDWAFDMACDYQDGVGGVEILGNGDIVSHGYFVSMPITFGTETFAAFGGPVDLWLAKLTANGAVLWADAAGGSSADYISSLYIRPDDHVLIAGVHTGSTNFTFGGLSQDFPDQRGVFVVDYNEVGNAAWIKRVPGGNNANTHLDPSGFLYLLSSFDGTIDLDGIPLTTFNEGPEDLFLAKMDVGTSLTEHAQGQLTVFPNPFVSSISIGMSRPVAAQLTVLDPLGTVVSQLSSTNAQTMTWNGRTTSGTEVPPGMYLVTVIADGQRYTQRVVKQ